jgi:predicted nucleotidyltransferase
MTPPITIRSEDLEIVVKVLRSCLPQGTQVWVFGSRAKGAAKRGSDLDLAIDAGRPLTSKEKSHLENDFYESNLPYKVDIVDMKDVSDTFRPYIIKEQVVLDWEYKAYFNPNVLINATLFISMYELLKGFIETRISGFFLDDILTNSKGNVSKVYSEERPWNGKKREEKEEEKLKFIKGCNLLNSDHIKLLEEAKHLRNKCAHELPELLANDLYERFALSV